MRARAGAARRSARAARVATRRAAAWLVLVVAALALPVEAATLASWNIRHLGHGDHKRFDVLGAVVERASFDFVAVQEAMTAEGVDALEAAIERATGVEWETMRSHDLGRGSYKEKYAFLWNPEVIEYVDGAVVYLDVTDRFAREPFSARFRIRDSGLTFVAATVHVFYGHGVADRTPEIAAIAEYWRWLREIYPEEADRIVLMGDFNLAPQHPAWAALRPHARPLIVEGATTLSSVDGRFANLYDNIWIPVRHRLPIAGAGIVAFPAAVGLTHAEARRDVSDHAPVWVWLDAAEHRDSAAPFVGPAGRE
ncbi:MAG TPA: endonuclease/exonuclease/phosphatase family protein [Gammaproteobacteria bacterium]